MGIITNKAKFIAQIMTSKEPARVSEDVDETVLTYSEMQAIASGNPMIKEKIQLDNDVAMLKTLKSEHKKSMYKMQELSERILPKRIEQLTELVHKASNDLKAYQEKHPENAEFAITIDGKIYTERKEAGEQLDKALLKCLATKQPQCVGVYCGFELKMEIDPKSWLSVDGQKCMVTLGGELKYSTELSLDNTLGNVRRIELLADTNINKQIQMFSEQLEKAKADLEDARAALNKPFEREDELVQKEERLAYVNSVLSRGSNSEPEPIIIDESSESEAETDREPVENTSMIMTVKLPVAAAAPVYDKPQTKPVQPQVKPKEQTKPITHKTRR